MSCREQARLLDGYVDGELDLAAALTLEDHVQSCARCKAALARLNAASMCGSTRRSNRSRLISPVNRVSFLSYRSDAYFIPTAGIPAAQCRYICLGPQQLWSMRFGIWRAGWP